MAKVRLSIERKIYVFVCEKMNNFKPNKQTKFVKQNHKNSQKKKTKQIGYDSVTIN